MPMTEAAQRPATTPTPELFRQANQLHRQNRLSEAEQIYEQILARGDAHPGVFHHLGLVRAQRGKFKEALEALTQAAARLPHVADIHVDLGNVLASLRHFDRAAASYDKAIALKPDLASAHGNLANVLAELNRPDDAIIHYRRAITLRPNHPDAYANMGLVMMELGRLDEARQATEKAIELAPQKTGFYRNLVDMKTFAEGDRHLEAMVEMAGRMDTLHPQAQLELNFALGKALTDVGQRQRAFGHVLAGNAMKRRWTHYDEAETLARFEQTKDVFAPGLFAAKKGLGDPSTLPIFVIGMPRSGTTLVEQILASHPKVAGAGELATFEQEMLNLRRFSSATAPFPEVVPALKSLHLGHLGRRYQERLKGIAPTAERVVDKMPANFRFAGLIHLALPNARIIHVRRNPVDTCLSCFSKLFAGEQPHMYDLAELGRYYRGYAALMRHWRDVLPAGVMLELRYEDLVTNLDTEARKLISFCGLDWSDACLEFHKTERAVHTASAVQVRRPVYSTAVGRSRDYADYLRPLVEALGDEAATAPSQTI